jgi:hypothetical protein
VIEEHMKKPLADELLFGRLAKGGKVTVTIEGDKPVFVIVPTGQTLPFLPAPEKRPRFDIMMIMDFNIGGGAYVSTMNYVKAAIKVGMKVAVFHWRRDDLDVSKPLNPEVRDLELDHKIQVISPGENVSADYVLVGYPPILRSLPDNLPKIHLDHLIVIVNQMSARLYDGGDPQYDPIELANNLKSAFGTAGVWAPISAHVKQLMLEDGRYPGVLDEIWTPLIQPEEWGFEPRRSMKSADRAPVVGRHSRDHYTKWPSSRDKLLAGYCADKPCEVRLLGGASEAEKIAGNLPQNWTIYEFGAMDAKAFLRGLDFFVHYPNENYIEEFGRSVLEAMMAGVPVILPERFSGTFGKAAIYAPEEEVWQRIEAIWRNSKVYLDYVRKGRSFAQEEANPSALKKRLDVLNNRRSA